MTSFSKVAWKSASIQKPPQVEERKRSDLWVEVCAVEITPLMPVSSETIQRMVLQTPTRAYEVYFEADLGLKIKEGYRLVVDEETYTIKGYETWDYIRNKATYLLVLEDVTP